MLCILHDTTFNQPAHAHQMRFHWRKIERRKWCFNRSVATSPVGRLCTVFMIENWGLLCVTRGNNDVSFLEFAMPAASTYTQRHLTRLLYRGVTSLLPAWHAFASIHSIQRCTVRPSNKWLFIPNKSSFDGRFVIFNYFSVCFSVRNLIIEYTESWRELCAASKGRSLWSDDASREK